MKSGKKVVGLKHEMNRLITKMIDDREKKNFPLAENYIWFGKMKALKVLLEDLLNT